MYESTLERNWALVFIANRSVINICEQQKVTFIRDGTNRVRFIDFLVWWQDGSVHAYEVKYAEDARRQRLREKLAADALCMPRGFADSYRVVTEDDLCKQELAQAEATIQSRIDALLV